MEVLAKEEVLEQSILFEDSLQRCHKCKNILPIYSFAYNVGDSGSRRITCKLCRRKASTERARIKRENNLEWQEKNKKKVVLPTIIPAGYKFCRACKLVLPIQEFTKNSDKKDNLDNSCRECHKQYRERSSIRIQEYAEAHREDASAYAKSHREIINARYKHRRDMLPSVKLSDNIRNRIRKSLRFQDANKEKEFNELLGCSIEFLRSYLESKFQDGMSWDNYGKHTWHLDHIRPCASFDLTDLEQQKECFHYTNYQPLWAKDNLSKGSWYNGEHYKHNKEKRSGE